MSLEKLEKEIRSASKKQVSELSKEAESGSSSILASAKAKAADIRDSAKSSARKEAARMKEEAESSMEIERNMAISKGVESLSKGYMGPAGKLVAGYLREAYGKKLLPYYIDSLKRTFKGIPADSLSIVADRQSAASLSKLGYKPRISNIDGFIAKTGDGSITFNATVTALMERNGARIKNAISRELMLSLSPILTPPARASRRGSRTGRRVAKG